MDLWAMVSIYFCQHSSLGFRLVLFLYVTSFDTKKKKFCFYLCFAEVVFHLDVFSSADVGCASL